MKTIKECLIEATHRLTAHSPSPRMDAEVLLIHVLQKNRTHLYAEGEQALTEPEQDRFHSLISERIRGVPIAYLIGTREFWSLPLRVSRDTLIPRPETELLVETTLSLFQNNLSMSMLDLGTGSGAIALACASERPDWHITASDSSLEALHLAQGNAERLQCKNVDFCHSDWFSNIKAPLLFDAIVSNPPYIASGDPHLNQGDLRFEPTLALVSGTDGLTAIRHIIQYALPRLKPGGLLLLEHGHDQMHDVGTILKHHGYIDIFCRQDAQGHDRVSGGRRGSMG